jgi:hypothetical protein
MEDWNGSHMVFGCEACCFAKEDARRRPTEGENTDVFDLLYSKTRKDITDYG